MADFNSRYGRRSGGSFTKRDNRSDNRDERRGYGEKKPYGERSFGEKKPYGERSFGE